MSSHKTVLERPRIDSEGKMAKGAGIHSTYGTPYDMKVRCEICTLYCYPVTSLFQIPHTFFGDNNNNNIIVDDEVMENNKFDLGNFEPCRVLFTFGNMIFEITTPYFIYSSY